MDALRMSATVTCRRCFPSLPCSFVVARKETKQQMTYDICLSNRYP